MPQSTPLARSHCARETYNHIRNIADPSSPLLFPPAPQATKQFYDTKEDILGLWCHETFRVIADRMWDKNDKEWLQKQLNAKLSALFTTDFNTLFELSHGEVPPYVTFMRAGTDNPPYEPVRDMQVRRSKGVG